MLTFNPFLGVWPPTQAHLTHKEFSVCIQACSTKCIHIQFLKMWFIKTNKFISTVMFNLKIITPS